MIALHVHENPHGGERRGPDGEHVDRQHRRAAVERVEQVRARQQRQAEHRGEQAGHRPADDVAEDEGHLESDQLLAPLEPAVALLRRRAVVERCRRLRRPAGESTRWLRKRHGLPFSSGGSELGRLHPAPDDARALPRRFFQERHDIVGQPPQRQPCIALNERRVLAHVHLRVQQLEVHGRREELLCGIEVTPAHSQPGLRFGLDPREILEVAAQVDVVARVRAGEA